MLRLWQVGTNGEAVWRASVEDPHTGERHGFANLDQLVEFLQEQMQDFKRSEVDAAVSRSRSIHLPNEE